VKVVVDRERCQGAGMCALTAPEVFDQSEVDGTVVVLDAEPSAELRDTVVRAAGLCPNSVIRLVGANLPGGSSPEPGDDGVS
jgi:ferredoxin